ncbi:MFS transporter [Cellulomonas sp. JZ18]|uniref:MFS transporter n=1 Tax=Cellulomonas sp. JZ18 TaxID=2654191 RepID=UPI0012D3EF15|nr:MFS transporter [Cellulomonas sp. JZ18]QGQ18349.1 MFS transporter [Cellulomonas sp. JZ18]
MVKRSFHPAARQVAAAAAPARTGVATALAGTLLVATTYGMARFAVGLSAPALQAERPALAPALGWTGTVQFTAYAVAALAVARVVDRRPRAGLVVAGATATLGCLGVALATDPAVLLLSVAVAGTGGALASPALVPVVDAAVPRPARPAAQSAVNAGTAVGVVGAGAVVAAVPATAPAWALMAALCAVTAGAAWWTARRAAGRPPGEGTDGHGPSLGGDDAPRPAPGAPLVRPAAAAVVVGAGSAMIWSFGPLVLVDAGAVPSARTGWLWVALGIGGVLGVLTGALVRHVGLRAAWATCSAALALATLGVAGAATSGGVALALGSTALFGAAYMAASGVLILWAREVWPGRAGAGTSVLFVALATGQALGAAGLGAARGGTDAVVLAGAAAALCALGAGRGWSHAGRGEAAVGPGRQEAGGYGRCRSSRARCAVFAASVRVVVVTVCGVSSRSW